ncbi:MAG: tetratricopeptide repeat protein [Chloroflexi bacterium]|nr:tetratricopeptide repeat protein [Chloroflexota bacterium]
METVSPNRQEPTPEFDIRCRETFSRWERGELPFPQALDALSGLRNDAAERGYPADRGRVEMLIGVLEGYGGDLDASLRHFERAREFFEQAGNQTRALSAVLNLGEIYRLKGDFTRARQFFHTVRDAAARLGVMATEATAIANEGLMLLSMGHSDEARALLTHGRVLAGQITEDEEERLSLLCVIEHGLASACVHSKNLQQAWPHAQTALALAHQIDQPLVLGMAYRAMGEVLTELMLAADAQSGGNTAADETGPLFAGDPDEYFHAANSAFEGIKAEGEIAQTMYTQGRSLSSRGRDLAAARKLQQALVIFTRLGMSDDAAKAAQAQMDALSRANP